MSSSLIILSIKKFVLNMRVEASITEIHVSLLLQMCCEESSFVDCFLYGIGTNTGLMQAGLTLLSREFLW